MRDKFNSIQQSVINFFHKTADKIRQLKIRKPSFSKKAEQAGKMLVSFAVRWWHWALGGLFAFMILYYPAGAMMYHHIDLDLRFTAQERPLNVLSALIGRETDKHAFTPNLPFFFPSALLDDMPSFQTGIINGARKTAEAFSEVNPSAENLKKASELLAYPASIWHIDRWKPAVSSVKKYRTARHLLLEYEAEVREEKQTFDMSAEALKTVAGILSEALKDCVRRLDRQVAAGGEKIWDAQADDVFYEVKGEAYVYYLVLQSLERELTEDSLRTKLTDASAFLEKAVRLRPLVVVNGAAETQLVPNHLLGQGFYLAQAALELESVK